MKANGHVARDDIERAAALVFRREGYRGSTMQQIADEVGLHKTSLYHHISSKESLLMSIAQVAIGTSLREIELIVAASYLSPTEKLRRAVHMQVIELTSRTDQVAVFTMYLDEISDEEKRLEFVARRNRYGELIEGIVADCLGVSTDSPEAKMTTFGILGMCNWMLNWYHDGGDLSADRLAVLYADMAVRAVSGTAPQA